MAQKINTKEQNELFILNKVEQLKVLAKEQQDPVFFVCAKFKGFENKRAMVEFTSYFMSDNPEPMDKEARLVILDYLENWVREEKKLLKK